MLNGLVPGCNQLCKLGIKLCLYHSRDPYCIQSCYLGLKLSGLFSGPILYIKFHGSVIRLLIYTTGTCIIAFLFLLLLLVELRDLSSALVWIWTCHTYMGHSL